MQTKQAKTTMELIKFFPRAAYVDRDDPSKNRPATELIVAHGTMENRGKLAQWARVHIMEKRPDGKFHDTNRDLTIRASEVQGVIEALMQFAGDVLISDAEQKTKPRTSTDRKPARAKATTAAAKPESWQQPGDDGDDSDIPF